MRGSARLDSLLFSVGTSCPGSLSLASLSLLRYFACSGSSFALVVVFILRVLTLFRNGLTGTAVCGKDECWSHGEACLFSDFVTVIARRQSVAILAQVLAEQILRWRFFFFIDTLHVQHTQNTKTHANFGYFVYGQVVRERGEFLENLGGFPESRNHENFLRKEGNWPIESRITSQGGLSKGNETRGRS